MTLAEKVRSVEEIFKALDDEVTSFKQWSGLQCQTGCGKCCFKPDISATVLEFLPLAYYLYSQGQADAWYVKLQNHKDGLCTLLKSSSSTGMCAEYPYRGLICRLFGFSARMNKYGKAEIITCQIIKSEMAGPYQQAVALVGAGNAVIPLGARYYMQLIAIDDELGRVQYPINEAILKALETVLSYYAYREDE